MVYMSLIMTLLPNAPVVAVWAVGEAVEEEENDREPPRHVQFHWESNTVRHSLHYHCRSESYRGKAAVKRTKLQTEMIHRKSTTTGPDRTSRPSRRDKSTEPAAGMDT